MLSCGRVKTELSKTLTSQHRFTTTYQSMRTDLWGSCKGILIARFLLSKFEQRSLNVAAFRVDGDLFENTPRVDADSFYTNEKRCVFKIIRIRVDEALKMSDFTKQIFIYKFVFD